MLSTDIPSFTYKTTSLSMDWCMMHESIDKLVVFFSSFFFGGGGGGGGGKMH